jgi:hypothetical protein
MDYAIVQAKVEVFWIFFTYEKKPLDDEDFE